MFNHSHYKSIKCENDLLWNLKKTTQFDIDIIPELDSMIDEDIKREHLILCRFCTYIITSPSHKIEINGKHNHTYKNPSGYIYHIGCFIEAKGCKNVGEPTTEFSWFPGFSWCYAICTNCHIHLGWYYQSNGNSFFGLILSHLLENI